MKKNRIFIIAEAGVNHNGSLSRALKMIDAAAHCGCDAVKFQTFKAKDIISKFAPKAQYQKKTTGQAQSQLDMIKKFELDLTDYQTLQTCCRKKNIIFMSSAFDLAGLNLLKSLNVEIFKIPSGEITNLPYLWKIGGFKKKIILSTGMSTMKEITAAIHILIKAGTKKSNITVLHCNTEYPTPFKDVNLRAMLSIQRLFNCAVGYSDHTIGIETAIAAAALGAVVIEKHFTLDKKLSGPDHAASLEPCELTAMVKAVRNIEIALGDGIKRPSASEIKNLNAVRKIIVAKRDVVKGELLTIENIALKRCGKGISAMKWFEILGEPAKKDFKQDQAISV